MKKISVFDCMNKKEIKWWNCPPSTTIFCIFLIIFAYSVYLSLECTYLINQYAKYSESEKSFEEIYKKSLGSINSTYVMSNLMCLISGLVIFGFIMKTIPESDIGNAFNYSTGLIISIYLFIFSAVALSTFSGMNYSVANSIIGFSAFILIISLITIGLFSYKIHHKKIKS